MVAGRPTCLQITSKPYVAHHGTNAKGGVFDQLAGGIARYSTDARWHLPHFEKMLYDNAQCISLYSEMAREWHLPEFEWAVRLTLEWCLKELYGEGEMFCSAMDADSEGVEGRCYAWTQQEFDALPPNIAPLLSEWFGINGPALWENNLNVLVRPFTSEDFCQKHGLEVQHWLQVLAAATEKLLEKRNRRPRPRLDDKQLLAWNALMIKGLCAANRFLGEARWLEIACNMQMFITHKMQTSEGGLLRTFKNGKTRIPAFLDDYAFYIQALIALYQSTFDEKHLLEARQRAEFAIGHFYCRDQGIFHFTMHGNSDLVVKPREFYDNVIPSSNAAMCLSLAALSIYFYEGYFSEIVRTLLEN